MRRLILLLISVVIMSASYAQLQTRKSTAAQWVENISDSAFFISRQSFQLSDKKTGELYGLNNKNVFGTEISLGIKIKNGCIVTNQALHPWEYNSKFKSYEDEYNPVLSASEFSEFGGVLKYDTLDISENKISELIPSSLYYATSNCFSNKGFVIDVSGGEKDGWIIWACTESKDDLDSIANLKLFCYSMPIVATDKSETKVDTPDGVNILGGIYVTPRKIDIGNLEFCLSGIIMEIDGEWKIHFPFIGKEKIMDYIPTKGKNLEANEGKDLTPIDDMYTPKKNKGKKSIKNKKNKK